MTVGARPRSGWRYWWYVLSGAEVRDAELNWLRSCATYEVSKYRAAQSQAAADVAWARVEEMNRRVAAIDRAIAVLERGAPSARP